VPWRPTPGLSHPEVPVASHLITFAIFIFVIEVDTLCKYHSILISYTTILTEILNSSVRAGLSWLFAHPRLPQFRACASRTHPVRQVVNSLSLNTTRWFRGDALVRHGVLSAVPTPCPLHDAAPPSLHEVREGPFPRFETPQSHSV